MRETMKRVIDVAAWEVSVFVFMFVLASIGFVISLKWVVETGMFLSQHWSTIQTLHDITSEGVYGETYLHVGKDVYSIKKVTQ